MQYPTLTDMGIKSPHEISGYTVRNLEPRLDVLTISYTRKPMSLLPVRRAYEFGRAIRTVVIDSGTSTMEDTYEVSPLLEAARAELDGLLGESGAQGTIGETASGLIDDLQKAIAQKASASEIEARLEELRKAIAGFS